MLKQLTVEAPDEKIRQTNLSCRTVTMRSRMRTETDCIRGFFVKKDFRAFPAYKPALSYNQNTGTNHTIFHPAYAPMPTA